MLKVDISLESYNKLRAKEEILSQLVTIQTPVNDYGSLLSTYRKIISVRESFDDMVAYDYDDIKESYITFNRKIYEYYLNIQMIFSQIENLSCSNPNNIDMLLQFWNTFFIYKSSFIKLQKAKSAEIEEFNTLIKIEKENRLLKIKKTKLETLLGDMADNSDKDFL